MARKKAQSLPGNPTKEEQRTPPPNAEYVHSLYQMRLTEGDEARLRTIAANMRVLAQMEHELPVPKQYRAITRDVKTPFIRDALLRATAALVHEMPAVHVEPQDDTEDAVAAANIAERWDQAAIDQMDKSTSENTIYEDTKALIRDGESVIKVVDRPSAWANFPERKAREKADEYSRRVDKFKRDAPFPIAWRAVDRLSMLFGDGEYGDDWCLEYGEYPLPYLGRRYGMVTDESQGRRRLVNPQNVLGGKPKPEGFLATSHGHSVKVEYWDQDWWHVVIDGEDAPGFPKENPYGALPYFRSKAADSESMLYSLMFLVPGLDALITMKMNWAYLGAYPNPVVKTVPNALQGLDALPLGDDGQPSKVQWKPGKLMELPIGKELEFLIPPPVGRDLDELIIIMRGLIDVAGIPSVFRGVGGSDQAGYAINQLMQAAALAFRLATLGQQNKYEKAFEFIHRRLIPYRFKQTVHVFTTGKESSGYVGLKPEGTVTQSEAPVDKLGPVRFSFKPILPTDEQARWMIANQLVNAKKPLWSRRYALEQNQVEDPEGMAEEIWVEQALEDPAIKGQIVQQALKRRGYLDNAQPSNPAAALVGPNGQPLLPGLLGAGVPSVPGLNTPLQPAPPAAPPIAPGQGGRAPGAFPGQPGGPNG